MTIDQLNKLSDEEVRVRVATKLGKHQYYGVLGFGYHCNVCGDFCEDEKHNIPNYPTDINAAFTLAEKLRGEGWQLILDNCDDAWRADFCIHTKSVSIHAPTPARAICLAFLAVTEREEG